MIYGSGTRQFRIQSAAAHTLYNINVHSMDWLSDDPWRAMEIYVFLERIPRQYL